jgi:hypothetical protein
MPQPLGSYRSATELRPRETDASRSRNSRLAPYCLPGSKDLKCFDSFSPNSTRCLAKRTDDLPIF